jgi:deoxycytidine triphosphate deaminase
MQAIINPKEILEKKIVYTTKDSPEINLSGTENQCQQHGIDLRLAKAYKIVGAVEFYTSKKSFKPDLIELSTTDNCYLFRAGEQYSLDFYEDVDVPEGLAALIINRSTINRYSGVISSGLFDNGYKSKGGCGAVFRPSLDTKIEIGFRMAQIVFYTAQSASLYEGSYQHSKEKNQ